MVVLHRAAGLTIAADRAVPGLPAASTASPADVDVHFDVDSPWRNEPFDPVFRAGHHDVRGIPAVSVSRCAVGYRFEYADDTRIWIDRSGREVWCTRAPSATFEDTATYVTGSALGFLLRLRGALALHASAVQVGDRAVAFVGPHGAGKSTTAAALGLRGCAVITDDVLHLTCDGPGWRAEPFAGVLRLWPESGELVLGPRTALPRITPGWDKRALPIGAFGTRAASCRLPVGAIVCLAPRERSDRAPRVERLPRPEALAFLCANSSAAHLLDPSARAVEFTAIADLVRSVPCASAPAHEEERAFGEFIDALLAWAQRPPTDDRGM